MIQLFKNKGKEAQKQSELATEIKRRAEVNVEARRMAVQLGSQSKQDTKSAIQKIDEILDKVSGFENSKITTLCELMIALETGDTKNLIQFLKKGDKVVRVKSKKKF